jgi:predicted restriction endonuclease
MRKLDKYGRSRDFSNIVCDQCNKPFEKATRFLAKTTKHYCSLLCVRESRKRRKKILCVTCKKLVEKPFSKIYDGLTFCSRLCKDKAQTLKEGLLKCGIGVPQYRTIAFANYEHKCELCGDDLLCVLEVHHIDENHINNKLENLIILCSNCHVLCTKGFIKILPDRKVIFQNIKDNHIHEKIYGRLAHSGERLVCIQEASGAEPLSSISYCI